MVPAVTEASSAARAEDLMRRGAYDEARRLLTDHDDVRSLVLLAVADLQTGDRTRAIATLRRAIEVDENDGRARAYLGYALLAAGDVDGSRENVDLAIALEPDSFAVRLIAGQCAFRLGGFPESIRQVTQALQCGAPDAESFTMAKDLLRQARERSRGSFERTFPTPRDGIKRLRKLMGSFGVRGTRSVATSSSPGSTK